MLELSRVRPMSQQAESTGRSIRSSSDIYSNDKWVGRRASHIEVSQVVSVKKMKLDHSPRIPEWVWRPLARSLGVKLHENDRPIVGTIIYVLLLIACFIFGSTGAWVISTDVNSNNTKSTVFTELIAYIIGFFWCAMGPYSYKLSYNVLTSFDLVQNIRLHARSFLKINSGILVTFIIVVLLGLQFYSTYIKMFSICYCELINLPQWLCVLRYIFLVTYSVLCAFWNFVITIIVMSITRTQTIVVRRFIREIEFDSKVLQKIYRLKNEALENPNHWADITEALFKSDFAHHYSDDEEDEDTDYFRRHMFDYAASQEVPNSGNSQAAFSQSMPAAPSDNDFEYSVDPIAASLNSESLVTPSEVFRNLQTNQVTSLDEYEALLLTADDLYYRHARLQRSMRLISIVFQRWISSWIFFVVAWEVSYIVSWLNKTPNYFDLILFALPIALILILCSGYAEANNECQSILRCMYCNEDRFPILRVYTQQPLQVGMFNVPLTYTYILSVLVALGVALLSRIVMDELPSSKK